MADLFISYSRRDSEVAERLAANLTARGWSVWWDRRIGAGQAFDRTIEDAIRAARAVLVIWSRHSVDSDWVRAEASFALQSNKLVPVLIDNAVPPLRFIHIHMLDLAGWDGSANAAEFERLAAEIAERLGVPAPPAATAAEVRPAPAAASPAHVVPTPAAPTPAEARPRQPDIATGTANGTATPSSLLPSLRRYPATIPAIAVGGAALLAAVVAIALHVSAPGVESAPPRAQSEFIGDPVPFDRGQVTLSAPAREAIDRQAAFLKEHPEITVTVTGTCTPEEGKRFGPGVLAQLRANKVRDELTERGGVAGNRILTAIGAAAQVCEAQSGRALVVRN